MCPIWSDQEDQRATSKVISRGFYHELARFIVEEGSYHLEGHDFHRFSSDSSPKPRNQRHPVKLQLLWRTPMTAKEYPFGCLRTQIKLILGQTTYFKQSNFLQIVGHSF